MELQRSFMRLIALSTILLCTIHGAQVNVRTLQDTPIAPTDGTITTGSNPTPAPTTKKPINRPWMTNSGTTTNTNGTTTTTMPSGGAVVIGVTDDSTRPGYSMDTGKSTFLGYFETEKIYLMASYIIPSVFILFKIMLFLYFCIVGLDSEEEQERKRKEQEQRMILQDEKNGFTPKQTTVLEQGTTAKFWIEEELQSYRMDLTQFVRIKPLTTTPNQRRHDNTTRDSVANLIAQHEYWLASYRQHEFVVLKWVVPHAKDMERQQDQLKYQVKRHAKLQHPYVIQLIGIAWSPATNLVIITEYMTRGDLRQWLHRTAMNEAGHWTSIKLQMVRHLALVLEYLHSIEPPLVHGNGNSRNVLLNDALEAKWSDFGGRTDGFRGKDVFAYQQVGSGRWISPESLIGANSPRKNVPNTAADIYALGILMVEMDSHTLPFIDRSQENEMDLLQQIAKGMISPTLLSSCPPPIMELVNQCTAFDPMKRPSARQVVASLDALLR